MQDRRQRRNCRRVVARAVREEPYVHPPATDVWRQPSRGLQQTQSVVPIFAAHGDHPEIRIRPGDTRVYCDHLTKSMLGYLQVAALQRSLPLRIQHSQILSLLKFQGMARYRTLQNTQKHYREWKTEYHLLVWSGRLAGISRGQRPGVD